MPPALRHPASVPVIAVPYISSRVIFQTPHLGLFASIELESKVRCPHYCSPSPTIVT
jgi:hypothetical protein